MDLYIVLGVNRGATLDEIKRAYKRLARRYHPDINPGDRLAAQQFREISEAYETLSDPTRRQRYDAGDYLPSANGAVTVGFEGFDFSVSTQGEAASTFGDLFAEVFQQSAAAYAEQGERGADLHYTIDLTFDEVMRGTTRDIAVSRQLSCAGCRGRGRLQVSESRCPRCQGTGSIRSARGHMVFSKACPHCGGSGLQSTVPCPECGGRRVHTRVETVSLRLPAGLADGERVRVAEHGHAGSGGAGAGDLYITVRTGNDPVFRREGDDLHVTVAIGVHEAALGAKVEVPSFDGAARVRVPPGTQSGQRFRLRERGVPRRRDGGRGDLVVEVRVALPPLLDERSKALLREFGELNPGDAVRSAARREGAR
jgi:molecular chaperone DnaJ